MLSAENNRLLTEVGPGTPMGDYLRRYWMPIGGVSEFDRVAIKPMRLFGENLVLYRDRSGTFGLIDRQCPHRRADLALGFVEDTGIRCHYHGWLMDAEGACIEQPYDDIANPRRDRTRCRTRAYPVKQAGGLLWAYMGPAPAPELPVWEPLTWENGFTEIVISEVPCNWFQCQENSCDPVHFEWMHENWSARLKEKSGPYAARHLKLKFEEFEHGFIYKRVREGADESDANWTIGRVALWPNGFYLSDHFEWRVPIDDRNTLSVCWFFTRVPRGREPYVQGQVPTWYGPVKDAQGNWITSHVINQDIIGWVGQGAVADRSRENLGASDVGITMMRRRFFDELAAVAKGAEPKGTIRNSNVARRVEIPNMERGRCVDGVTLAEFANFPVLKARLEGFRWQYGQPDEVRRAFEAAIGIG